MRDHNGPEGLDYEKIFNTVPDMIIIQDAETGQVITVNDETVARTGYSREEGTRSLT